MGRHFVLSVHSYQLKLLALRNIFRATVSSCPEDSSWRSPWCMYTKPMTYNMLLTTSIQANILISDDFRIQLGDFGLSRFEDASSASASSYTGGAARWLAPELLRGSRPTYASDIYAFGCVWLEVGPTLMSCYCRFLTKTFLDIHTPTSL